MVFNSGFSLRILVAGVTGEKCERGSMSEYKIVSGYQMLAREMCVVHGEFPDL